MIPCLLVFCYLCFCPVSSLWVFFLAFSFEAGGVEKASFVGGRSLSGI